MTDEEFRRMVAQELADMRQAINEQTKFLRILSEQQSQLNQILRDICDSLEPRGTDDEDPYGLFEDDEP